MVQTSPVGVAIIGLGTVGRRFIEQFESHPGFGVIGGFDLDASARASAENDLVIRVHDDPDALIVDPDVDMVYIAVPPLHHETYVDQVMAAHKSIFCEKPLGVDDMASAALVQRVTAWPGQAAVNFVFGGAPGAVHLIDRVRSGTCGSIRGVDLRVHFCRWPRDWQAGATWLRDRDQGGWVREVVSHYLFLIGRLFESVAIEAVSVEMPDDGTSERSLVAVLRCDGVPVRLVGTSDTSGPDEVQFTVRGATRSLRLTNWYQLTEAVDDDPWSPVLDEQQMAAASAYRAQLDQVERFVSGNDHTLATFQEALAVQVLAEELLNRGAAN